MAHRSHTSHWRSPIGRVLVGTLLLAWGAAQLADNLNIPGFEAVSHYFWPSAAIAWGLVAFLFGRGGLRLLGVVGVASGVMHLGNQFLGWHLGWHLLWPLLLIVFGIRMMSRRPPFPPRAAADLREGVEARFYRDGDGGSSTGAAPSAGPSSGATSGPSGEASSSARPSEATNAEREDRAAVVREFALLGGVERNNTSQAFQGGQITAALGGVQLDLRESRIAGPSARLDVLAVMGGVSLRIPREWCVVSEIAVVLGGLDDRTAPPVDPAAPRLIITGHAIMGGIEVKN